MYIDQLLVNDDAVDAGTVFSNDVHHIDSVAELSHVDDGLSAFGSLVVNNLAKDIDDADALHVGVGVDVEVAVGRVRIDGAHDVVLPNAVRISGDVDALVAGHVVVGIDEHHAVGVFFSIVAGVGEGGIGSGTDEFTVHEDVEGVRSDGHSARSRRRCDTTVFDIGTEARSSQAVPSSDTQRPLASPVLAQTAAGYVAPLPL